MKIETVKCDVCGRVKGEANKWLALRINNPLEFAVGRRHISVVIGALEDFDDSQREDICSDTCLQKRLGEVLLKIRSELLPPFERIDQ